LSFRVENVSNKTYKQFSIQRILRALAIWVIDAFIKRSIQIIISVMWLTKSIEQNLNILKKQIFKVHKLSFWFIFCYILVLCACVFIGFYIKLFKVDQL